MGRWMEMVKPKVEWKAAWTELAVLTDGLTREDRRFSQVLEALDACDRAYHERNPKTFLKSADLVKDLMRQ
ncbi:hypothetical protein [Candidatus Nitrospira bockiana]